MRTVPRYIPEGSDEITREGVEAVVYTKCTDGLTAIGYRGKAGKPSFNYGFRSVEQLERYLDEFFASQAANQERAQARRDERKNLTNETLPVGTILCSSWGYDQTNVDFYEVTALVGKVTVTIQKIAASQVAGTEGFMSCQVAPDASCKIGKPFNARVSSVDSVTFSEYQGGYRHYARIFKGGTTYCSWYA